MLWRREILRVIDYSAIINYCEQNLYKNKDIYIKASSCLLL